MYDNLKGKNVMIDISDGTSDDDGHSDDDGYGDDDGHSDDDGYGVDDGLDDYRLDELTEEDVYEMTFDSDEDGERFYNAYAKVKVFSVRKDNIHKDNEDIVTLRKWVCSKEGYREAKYIEREDRKKEPMAQTRVGCPAIFHLKLDRKSNKYVVANFVSFHNHNLIGPMGVPFLRSHRKVRSPDKASANTMHKVGIKTSHIMDFAAQQSGGYNKVGYTQKDLYNHFTAQRKIEVADGDAEEALAYLCAKAEYDPLFYYKYDVDEQNRLNNMFWRDSTSLTDYQCFGDVLLFDATYRTNAYGKPFVILVGVNSHFQTAIFGCALLTAETVETYTWVLEKFLDSMGNEKMPMSVMTDGDKATRRAIKTVLPNTRHRLCKWHLKKNVVSNVHVSGFLCDFEKCMSMPTEEEFEIVWTNLVDNYNLHENNWAIEVYKKRHLWAEGYLRGIFFAGARSTQRVEGMNAFMNGFLKLRLRLFEFVQAYDRALAKLRHNEAKAQVESENSTPILSTAMKRISMQLNHLINKSNSRTEDKSFNAWRKRLLTPNSDVGHRIVPIMYNTNETLKSSSSFLLFIK
ncbi:protein FAR1-RELATED SEQUENCE 5-like [Rhododendron vialii]|uniref:protein FAR1-RELATED SEQUENCE 5-like n=1 Tax=Rhododendron vialii TaxID=182163 RepID=UPI00265E37E2|nr:protein FAR1-RELATED SEQUENCE 5-like [Rhododendron vialii]